MMIKMIGCAAIILSGTYSGFLFAARLEKRKNVLKTVSCLMNETEIYLSGEVMTTENIISSLCAKKEYKEIIDCCLHKKGDCLEVISHNERQVLNDFFLKLGKTDLYSQLNLIKMYKSVITESYDMISEISKNKCRLYRTSGILVSMMLCLLLI